MKEDATDAEARITAAMLSQLLNKLREKGVLDKSDVEEIMIGATRTIDASEGGGSGSRD